MKQLRPENSLAEAKQIYDLSIAAGKCAATAACVPLPAVHADLLHAEVELKTLLKACVVEGMDVKRLEHGLQAVTQRLRDLGATSDHGTSVWMLRRAEAILRYAVQVCSPSCADRDALHLRSSACLCDQLAAVASQLRTSRQTADIPTEFEQSVVRLEAAMLLSVQGMQQTLLDCREVLSAITVNISAEVRHKGVAHVGSQPLLVCCADVQRRILNSFTQEQEVAETQKALRERQETLLNAEAELQKSAGRGAELQAELDVMHGRANAVMKASDAVASLRRQ
eukprot:5513503-Amphidinium_carterae.1